MLIQRMNVKQCETDVILLTKSTHAYLVHVEEQHYLYVTDIKNQRHVPVLLATFNSGDEAIAFIEEFWSQRKIVQQYEASFLNTQDKPATDRQIETTQGNATTYGETTWYFAKAKCQQRMKLIVELLKNGIQELPDRKETELEKLMKPE